MSSLMFSYEQNLKTMIDGLPVLGRARYLIKSTVPHQDFKLAMSFLHCSIENQWELPLASLADHIGVTYNTAAIWLDQIKQNPHYDPSHSLSNRAMSDRLEQTIMQAIEDIFLEKNYFFNKQILKTLAIHE
jgi:hypothetical protein